MHEKEILSGNDLTPPPPTTHSRSIHVCRPESPAEANANKIPSPTQFAENLRPHHLHTHLKLVTCTIFAQSVQRGMETYVLKIFESLFPRITIFSQSIEHKYFTHIMKYEGLSSSFVPY